MKPVARARYGPMIALFGSYGLPLAGHMSFLITPMQFTPNQYMLLKPLSRIKSNLSIFFTSPEFEHCISLIIMHSIHSGQTFLPCKDFVKELWVMTNGYLGVIKELICFMIEAMIYLIDESHLWSLYTILMWLLSLEVLDISKGSNHNTCWSVARFLQG